MNELYRRLFFKRNQVQTSEKGLLRMRKVGHWEEVVERDFPERRPVTVKTRESLKENPLLASRYRCSMRIATGRIYTDEEFEARRTQVFSTELP